MLKKYVCDAMCPILHYLEKLQPIEWQKTKKLMLKKQKLMP
jgi:hypothetical protein